MNLATQGGYSENYCGFIKQQNLNQGLGNTKDKKRE